MIEKDFAGALAPLERRRTDRKKLIVDVNFKNNTPHDIYRIICKYNIVFRRDSATDLITSKAVPIN